MFSCVFFFALIFFVLFFCLVCACLLFLSSCRIAVPSVEVASLLVKVFDRLVFDKDHVLSAGFKTVLSPSPTLDQDLQPLSSIAPIRIPSLVAAAAVYRSKSEHAVPPSPGAIVPGDHHHLGVPHPPHHAGQAPPPPASRAMSASAVPIEMPPPVANRTLSNKSSTHTPQRVSSHIDQHQQAVVENLQLPAVFRTQSIELGYKIAQRASSRSVDAGGVRPSTVDTLKEPGKHTKADVMVDETMIEHHNMTKEALLEHFNTRDSDAAGTKKE